MKEKYVVERERQVNGMDYQVVTLGFRSSRNVICFCYYEYEAQRIADALNEKYKKGE